MARLHEKKNGAINGKHKIEAGNTEVAHKELILNAKEIGTDFTYTHEIVWPNLIGFLILHILAIWAVGIVITGGVYLKTFIWTIFLAYFSAEGILMGAHRLYTHKSFKATPLLKAILILGHTIAGQNCLYVWARDHRLHHRFSDTDGDPHNSKRGFFFSHIGWLMTRKHPYVIELGKRVDLSDLQADWMVMLQKKYYYYFYAVFAVFIPVWIPVYFFGESWLNSYLVAYILRWTFQLHATWLVNSAAHLYGTRPYDKDLQAVESWFVSLLTLGEGWHNYHHAFPWDYKTAEWGMHYNLTATLIRFCETIGLAYDLKTAPPEMVKNRISTKGDGTHYIFGNDVAQSAVTASKYLGGLHPLNPSYNVTYSPPNAVLDKGGLPLFSDNDTLDVTKVCDSYIIKYNMKM